MTKTSQSHKEGKKEGKVAKADGKIDERSNGRTKSGTKAAKQASPPRTQMKSSADTSTPPMRTAAPSSSDTPSSTSPTPIAAPTTRLCVKNLPIHLKEDRLRKIFEKQGQVTDAKLLKTSDGRSRKMAFIGYRTQSEATNALEYFHRTFIDTSRIDVEYALDPRKAKQAVKNMELRPWSKYSEGSSRNPETAAMLAKQKAEKENALKAARENDSAYRARLAAASSPLFAHSALFGLSANANVAKLLNDPKFKEYLHVMSNRSKNKFWSNHVMDVEEFQQAATAANNAGMTNDRHRELSEAERNDITNETGYQTYEAFLAERREKKKLEKQKNGNAGAVDDEDDSDDDEYFNQPMLDRDDTTTAKTASSQQSDAMEQDDDGTDAPAAAVNPLALNDAVSDLEYLKSKQADDSEFSDDDEDNANAMEDVPAVEGNAQTAQSQTSRKRKGSTVDGEGGTTEQQDGEHATQNEEDEADAELKAEYEREQKVAHAAEQEQKEKDEMRDSGRLFLRNLSYTITEADLREALEPFGALAELHLPLDAQRKPKGFAYATFMFPAHAHAALESLDGSFLLGRLLHVLSARPKPGGNKPQSEWERVQAMSDAERHALGYKKLREIEQQHLAGSAKDQKSWNSLFIRSDTVSEAIAAKYGLSKSALLDTDAGADGEGGPNLAVRLALAESQLINETKTFLSEHGVDVAVFDGERSATAPRSSRALLVKNIPYHTETDEIRRLFSKFGTLSHVVMPPSRSLALVEFEHEVDAMKAFKGLAYKKFKYVPIYLEWAPKGVFEGTTTKKTEAVTGQKGAQELLGTSSDAAAAAASASIAATPTAAAAVSSSSDNASSSTLYVKNLNFSTSESSLRALFAPFGPLRSVNISKKKNTRARPHTDDPLYLSMGFGFVEFVNAKDALTAMKALQGKQLDQHALEIKVSNRGAASSSSSGASSSSADGTPDGSSIPSSKLLVKNVPFETTSKELRDLFSPFGSIQRIRLPRKPGTNQHRGFAFIDFVTKSEAAHAKEAVKHSHLYGRHLVIEWAAKTVDAASQDVAAMQEKTKQQYAAQQAGPPAHKKRKVQEPDEIDEAFDKKFI